MRPVLYQFTCGNCNHKFKAPQITEAYGEFIMRSQKLGDPVYLSVFADKVVNEVMVFFENDELIEGSKWIKNADIFQTIFSVSCDLASDGSQYSIRAKPICPHCGSREMASWGMTNPPEYMQEDIGLVQHECWNKLSYNEKAALIHEAVKSYLDDHKMK